MFFADVERQIDQLCKPEMKKKAIKDTGKKNKGVKPQRMSLSKPRLAIICLTNDQASGQEKQGLDLLFI